MILSAAKQNTAFSQLTSHMVSNAGSSKYIHCHTHSLHPLAWLLAPLQEESLAWVELLSEQMTFLYLHSHSLALHMIGLHTIVLETPLLLADPNKRGGHLLHPSILAR